MVYLIAIKHETRIDSRIALFRKWVNQFGKYSMTDRVPAISKVVDVANITNFVGSRDLFHVCETLVSSEAWVRIPPLSPVIAVSALTLVVLYRPANVFSRCVHRSKRNDRVVLGYLIQTKRRWRKTGNSASGELYLTLVNVYRHEGFIYDVQSLHSLRRTYQDY